VRHLAAMAPLSTQADRLEATLASVLALRPRVEAAGLWPLAELYGTEAEASWGPPELLAHVAEMLPYWLAEAERLIDGCGGVTPFGRAADDSVRIGIIGRDRTVPLRALFERVEADGARVARRMRELTANEAGCRGIRPARGELTVAELFERFVVGHLEEHLEQLRAILADRGA
jgi:DinB superfamily